MDDDKFWEKFTELWRNTHHNSFVAKLEFVEVFEVYYIAFKKISRSEEELQKLYRDIRRLIKDFKYQEVIGDAWSEEYIETAVPYDSKFLTLLDKICPIDNISISVLMGRGRFDG